MTKAKIAISVPRPLLEKARRAVRTGRAANVSAYFTEALEEHVKLDDLGDLLAQMLAETGGPLTAAERRAADAALGVQPRKGKAKGRAA
jgi:Arc/MetJ-type ribon-helix-helix transcriptional regulator